MSLAFGMLLKNTVLKPLKTTQWKEFSLDIENDLIQSKLCHGGADDCISPHVTVVRLFTKGTHHRTILRVMVGVLAWLRDMCRMGVVVVLYVSSNF